MAGVGTALGMALTGRQKKAMWKSTAKFVSAAIANVVKAKMRATDDELVMLHQVESRLRTIIGQKKARKRKRGIPQTVAVTVNRAVATALRAAGLMKPKKKKKKNTKKED